MFNLFFLLSLAKTWADLWLANYNFASHNDPCHIVTTRIVWLMRSGFLPLNVIDFKGVRTGPGCGETQGGDVVYGWGGVVTKSEDASQVVGKSVIDGVLSQISAKEGTKCRGPMFGNDSPQALWVFSSDACGVYGIAHLEIAHARRSNPVGLIVLSSDTNNLTVRSGTGMLLRVSEVSK